MLTFKRRHEWRKDARPVGADALVECVVAEAGCITSGDIETLQIEVRALVRIVGHLAAQLPAERLAELADMFGYERAQSEPQPADPSAS